MNETYPSSLNGRAYKIARQMIERADAIGVLTTKCHGATVVDAGVDVPGSPEAGRLFSQICLGGAGPVALGRMTLDDMWIPSVSVTVDTPALACMASQYAGWTLKSDEEPYFAMASGPARALYAAEAIFGELDVAEKSDIAVLALETGAYPPEDIVKYIAQSCGVTPEKLVLLLAPTASIVGCVQVASRIVETGLHKLHELGFDIRCIRAGWGEAPIAPIASNDGQAIGWTNDGILYGGTSWYTVDCKDDAIESILDRLPACSSSDYGTPFFELLKRYEWNFYKIDPMLFSPAVVYINNVRSGRTYKAGRTMPQLLVREWVTVPA